jgi:hypothetical protein
LWKNNLQLMTVPVAVHNFAIAPERLEILSKPMMQKKAAATSIGHSGEFRQYLRANYCRLFISRANWHNNANTCLGTVLQS